MGAAFIPLIVLLFLLSAKTYSQKGLLLSYCGDSNYTAGSPFKSDIDALVANLTSSSAAYFATSSAGAAYGLAQCHPDATPTECAACHNETAAFITARCPLAKSAFLRLDYCVLRYSDQLFFSQTAGGPVGLNPCGLAQISARVSGVFNRCFQVVFSTAVSK